MKYTFIAIIIAVSISCTEKPSLRSINDVYIDLTDSAIYIGKYGNCIDQILDMMDVDTLNKGIGYGEVSFHVFNHLSDNIATKAVLTKSKGLNEVHLNRIQTVKEFRASLHHHLQTILSDSCKQQKESRIYQPLCEGLQRLASSKAQQKTVILFTDGLENSSLLSFYDISTDATLVLFDSIQNRFESACALPDLSEINIHVVCTPNTHNDSKVQIAKKFWQRLFESKNVKHFSWSANLNLPKS